MTLRTLLIDNHDSYTFNLFQLIAGVNGVEPDVVTNDDAMLTRLSAAAFDNIVISPGPGRPQVARDIGFLAGLLRTTTVPILGVCLGHQAIAYEAGAQVGSAPRPRHGHLSQIRHDGGDLFAGLPAEFTGVRYHSLCVQEPLPATLTANAWAEDGVIMAVHHRDLPRWGVQFHPESIATHYGREILANFAELTHQAHRDHRLRGPHRAQERQPVEAPRPAQPPPAAPGSALQLITKAMPSPVPTDTMFAELFASSPTCFWLDSSLVQPGLSRFSFLGDGSGPLSETLTYHVGDPGVEIRNASGVYLAAGNAFDVLDRRPGPDGAGRAQPPGHHAGQRQQPHLQ
jgi:para-aminobenzoate synthetase